MRMLVYLMYVLYLNLFSVIPTRCILTIHIKVLCYTGAIIIIVVWQNTESLILAHSYRHCRLFPLFLFFNYYYYLLFTYARKPRTSLAIITLRSILKFRLQIERPDSRRAIRTYLIVDFFIKGIIISSFKVNQKARIRQNTRIFSSLICRHGCLLFAS